MIRSSLARRISPPDHPETREDGPQTGFALVIALSLMAFILLLLVSLTSLVRVEARSAAQSLEQLAARQNALLGLKIALGELQRHAGPDQRVSAPATAVFPEKNVLDGTGELFDIYRGEAINSERNTYLTRTERTNWEQTLRAWWNAGGKNPRWTAFFDSSRRIDETGGDLAPERYEEDTDTHYGMFDYNQNPRWLISGNENLDPTDPSYFQPDADLTAQIAASALIRESVEIVASPEAGLDSVDGLPRAVRVPKVPLQRNNTTPSNGHYAFWVSDENTKADLGVREPEELASTTDPASKAYRSRLVTPQQTGLALFPAFMTGNWEEDVLRRVIHQGQIPLTGANASTASDLKDLEETAFHHYTVGASSLLSDTALGGLKQDLSAYLLRDSGILDNAPVIDPDRYRSDDLRFGNNNTGFPMTTDGVPVWADIKSWHDEEADSDVDSVAPSTNRAPALSNYRVFFAITREGNTLQMHFLPFVVLWNPYDAALSSANYRLEWRHNFYLWRVGFAHRDAGYTDPTPDDDGDGRKVGDWIIHPLDFLDWFDKDSSNYKGYGTRTRLWGGGSDGNPEMRFAPFDLSREPLVEGRPDEATFINYTFSTGFEAGEAKVFTVGSTQKINDLRELHNGSETVELTNEFLTDFPESWYFDFARFSQPATNLPEDADDVAFYGELLVGGATPGFMSMRLFSGGEQLWENIDLGNPGNWGSQIAGDPYGPATIYHPLSNEPQSWRKVFTRNEWETRAKGSRNSILQDSPIVSMYSGQIEPFVPSTTNLDRDGTGDARQGIFQGHARAFAVYNPFASSTDLSRPIEGARDGSAVNNSDEFLNFQFFKASASRQGTAWDEGRATGTNGFTLMEVDNRNDRIEPNTHLSLRKVKRAASDVLSIGQLQQANLSRKAWQPAFPIGNSEASPYVDRARVAGLESYEVGTGNGNFGIWVQRSPSELPNDPQNQFLDLSYLLNENLWDRFFLSGYESGGLPDPDRSEFLPNSRLRFGGDLPAESDFEDADRAAAYLRLHGGFNVNSTSVPAWTALLSAARDLRIRGQGSPNENPSDTVPVPRSPDSLGEALEFTFDSKNPIQIGAVNEDADFKEVLTGFRYLTDDMIETLAERIVDEVRLRGPFFSLADFVNRRLVTPGGGIGNNPPGSWVTARTENTSGDVIRRTAPIDAGYDPLSGLSGINGALQRAINLSGINGGMNYPFPDDDDDRAYWVDRDLQDVDGPAFQAPADLAWYLDAEHLAGAPAGEMGQLLSHSPGHVSQADILTLIGSALTARGDTFRIRAYGDSSSGVDGNRQASAILEATVRRTVEPVTAAANSGTDQYRPTDGFGRRFEIVGMRWLTPKEL